MANPEVHTGESITHWRTTWEKKYGNWRKWAAEDAAQHNNSDKIYNRENMDPFTDPEFDFEKERPQVGARYSHPEKGMWDNSDGWDDHVSKFDVESEEKKQRQRLVEYKGSSAWQLEEDARQRWNAGLKKKQERVNSTKEENERLHHEQELFVAWKKERGERNELEREQRRLKWRNRALAEARAQYKGTLKISSIPFEKRLQAYRVVGRQFDPNFDYLSTIHYPENDDVDDRVQNVGVGTPSYEALQKEHIEHRERIYEQAQKLYNDRRDQRVAEGGPRWDTGDFDYYKPFTSDVPGGYQSLNGEDEYMDRLKKAGAAAIAAGNDDNDDIFFYDIPKFNQRQRETATKVVSETAEYPYSVVMLSSFPFKLQKLSHRTKEFNHTARDLERYTITVVIPLAVGMAVSMFSVSALMDKPRKKSKR